MKDRTLTPPAPLIRGEPATPSPDKGRVGEGLKYLPYNQRLTALARQNRHNPTPAESLLWSKVLRGRQFEHYKFLRQKPIGDFIVDFYCAELRLVIEIDGDSHADQIDYAVRRTRFLNSLGLHVLRYSNRDVLDNLPGLYDDLSTHFASQNHD